jgi:hypothetical protein
LTSHDRNKEFWNEVVIFTSKDDNLTKSHIKFLESALTVLARKADRFELENGNTPPESSLPRADRDAMGEFIENTRMVLGVLGYPILEPLLKVSDSQSPASDSDATFSDLVFSVNNVTAYGALTDEGFVIKKNSQFSTTNSDSLAKKLSALKERYLDSGVLVATGDVLISAEDILMTSSSYAAAIVAGTSRSGPQSWKSRDGRYLKELEDKKMSDVSKS